MRSRLLLGTLFLSVSAVAFAACSDSTISAPVSDKIPQDDGEDNGAGGASQPPVPSDASYDSSVVIIPKDAAHDTSVADSAHDAPAEAGADAGPDAPDGD
jgi:hypothetical protein